MALTNIKLMADYGCWPLWFVNSEQVENLNPENLLLSDALRSELKLWATQYDLTLNEDDPASSGFPDQKAIEDFKLFGGALAARLQSELGADYRVIFSEAGLALKA